jgi:hypothetical protein
MQNLGRAEKVAGIYGNRVTLLLLLSMFYMDKEMFCLSLMIEICALAHARASAFVLICALILKSESRNSRFFF